MQRDNHDQHEIRTVPWGEQALVEDYDILGEKTGDAALITVEAPQVRKDSMDEKEYAKVFVTVIGKDGTYDAGQLAYAHAYALLSDGSKIDIHWDVMNDTALDGQVKPGEKVSGYIAFETDQIPEKVVVQGMYLDEVEWTGDSES
ncbi:MULTISPECIES: hypothetical protein [Gordonia]|uniref:Uncharacterized protein n=2 Tax=Gordonia amicalis TaxID=89053 RepID=A0AAE4UBF6_9ACTN|nr:MULTISPECIES: hypothetical protein [Gordonia]ATD70950.1 hypothetical protein CNO18_12390 [Gordonia sp. 1D]MCZ4581943.1 hypothetical protein [Gordonia amicalis]MCZ4653064.1 hypothetical protein [Gordonia amicalis]MDJ0455450.1 hypothetical protein [Gordonia amicalis]MDV6310199.1 hypothetical protein [Gordonia amicalis]